MPNIDEQIRKAMEEGKFDNLPGEGKPLKLDNNPHEDPEWRLTYTMLKNSGFSLPWIESRRDLEERFEKASADLRRAWSWHSQQSGRQGTPTSAQNEWLRATALFKERCEELNKNILAYNLKAPSPRFHRNTIDIEKEIDRVMQGG